MLATGQTLLCNNKSQISSKSPLTSYRRCILLGVAGHWYGRCWDFGISPQWSVWPWQRIDPFNDSRVKLYSIVASRIPDPWRSCWVASIKIIMMAEEFAGCSLQFSPICICWQGKFVHFLSFTFLKDCLLPLSSTRAIQACTDALETADEDDFVDGWLSIITREFIDGLKGALMRRWWRGIAAPVSSLCT